MNPTQDEGWKERFSNQFRNYLGGEEWTRADVDDALFEMKSFIEKEISQAESQAVERYKEELRGKVPEEVSADVATSLETPHDVLVEMQHDMKNFREGWNTCRSQVLALLSVDEVNGKES